MARSMFSFTLLMLIISSLYGALQIKNSKYYKYNVMLIGFLVLVVSNIIITKFLVIHLEESLIKHNTYISMYLHCRKYSACWL